MHALETLESLRTPSSLGILEMLQGFTEDMVKLNRETACTGDTKMTTRGQQRSHSMQWGLTGDTGASGDTGVAEDTRFAWLTGDVAGIHRRHGWLG